MSKVTLRMLNTVAKTVEVNDKAKKQSKKLPYPAMNKVVEIAQRQSKKLKSSKPKQSSSKQPNPPTHSSGVRICPAMLPSSMPLKSKREILALFGYKD